MRARSGPQISSVTPGYTVDSYTTTSPFLSTLATVSEAFTTGVKSGRLFLSTGVGTATTKKVAFASSFESYVMSSFDAWSVLLRDFTRAIVTRVERVHLLNVDVEANGAFELTREGQRDWQAHVAQPNNGDFLVHANSLVWLGA